MNIKHKYLFILCPPYSGSTVLWRLLASSPNVSTFEKEGQSLDGVKDVMRNNPWNPENKFPWHDIKHVWEEHWDHTKLIFLEKSPPNLIRAFEIEKYFSPSKFIVMIRNPYANCEGIRRRHKGKLSISEAAEAWVFRAQYQIKNIKGLKNVMNFTYESLTENTKAVNNKILNFFPELQRVDIDTPVLATSIVDTSKSKIKNYNAMKINTLSAKDIKEINSVLEKYPDIMDFFGYEYIYPTIHHQVRNIFSSFNILVTKYKQKFWRRVARGVK